MNNSRLLTGLLLATLAGGGLCVKGSQPQWSLSMSYSLWPKPTAQERITAFIGDNRHQYGHRL